MLDVWLLPLLAVMAAIMLGFYLLIRFKGGNGVRIEGKTVVHKDMAEEDLPPA